MNLEQVANLSNFQRFVYWIQERHQIHLKRKAGKPKPWTDDEVLRSYFFTNPYRENDKVTVWFRENVREPLRDDPRVLFATVAFRWFNLPETGSILMGDPANLVPDLLINWNPTTAIKRLDVVRKRGGKIFTGAFMINSPAGEPKLEAIVRRIDNVWKDREKLTEFFLLRLAFGQSHGPTMQEVHSLLTKYDGLGGFMAYEVVCDLRYTYLLENATDKMTWCNPGPGAVRGICRILDIPFEKGKNAHGFTPSVPIDVIEEIQKLLKRVQKALPRMPKFEMREIEHSLCEFDKYERARLQDGRMKRTYKGV